MKARPSTDIDTIKLLYDIEFVPGMHPNFKIVFAKPDKAQVLWTEYEGTLPDGTRCIEASPRSKPARRAMTECTIRSVRGAYAQAWVGALRPRIFRCRDHKLRLGVTFSPANCRDGHNAGSAGINELLAAVEELEQAILRLGVRIDGLQGSVRLLHLKRDARLSRPSATYMPVLRAFAPPYSRFFNDFSTGVARGSYRRRWSIYGKNEQINHLAAGQNPVKPQTPKQEQGQRARSYLACIGNPYLLRFEWQLQTKSALKDVLEINTVRDLVGSEARLDARFDEELHRALFRWEIPANLPPALPAPPLKAAPTFQGASNGCDMSHSPITSAITSSPKDGSAVWIANLQRTHRKVCACALGNWNTKQDDWGTQKLRTNIRHAEPDASRRSRLLRNLDQARLTSVLPDGTPWITLYAELYDAVLGTDRPRPRRPNSSQQKNGANAVSTSKDPATASMRTSRVAA